MTERQKENAKERKRECQIEKKRMTKRDIENERMKNWQRDRKRMTERQKENDR